MKSIEPRQILVHLTRSQVHRWVPERAAHYPLWGQAIGADGAAHAVYNGAVVVVWSIALATSRSRGR